MEIEKLFLQSAQACENCYLYSKVDYEKRDKYNEHAMNSLQAVLSFYGDVCNSSFDKDIAKKALGECIKCEYESEKIKEALINYEVI